MSSKRETNVPLPAPFVVAPSTEFQGNDGNWSTFTIEIGSPSPQVFNVLPATVGQEFWVPSTSGCSGPYVNLTDCGQLRGADNTSSDGFNFGNSESWRLLGTYSLSTEVNLYGEQDATYGLDTVALKNDSTSSFSTPLAGQIIGTYNTPYFWLGQFGLGALSGNFNNGNYSSPLSYMKKSNITPSISFGYTAGKYYDSKLPGSLVLGGYDAARVDTQNTISFPIAYTAPTTLEVNVTDITVSNGLTTNILKATTEPMVMNIDSSTSEIWLPTTVCDNIASAYGLEYDNSTGLYLSTNNTNRAQLTSNASQMFFTIGSNVSSSTMVVRIPWNAFDLSYMPYYPSQTQRIPYFPFRRAANSSQYTLGRTFLQEAYIIVDWERLNLTVAAATDSTTPDITTILPLTSSQGGSGPTTSGSTPGGESHKSGGSSAGAIAGGVVGGIAALVIILGIILFIRRRNRKRNAQPKDVEKTSTETPPVPAEYYRDEVAKPPPPQNPEPEEAVAEYYPPEKTRHHDEKNGAVDQDIYELRSPDIGGPAELESTQRHELPGAVPNRDELMSTPLHEMPGSEVGSELGISGSRSVRSPAFRSIDSPSPDVFGTPSPEQRFMSPVGSSSSVQLGPSSAVHHFSSSHHQEVVPSSEIVSNSAERDRLGAANSEIVVNSSPNELVSPTPVREAASPLAGQPAEDLVHSHERRTD